MRAEPSKPISCSDLHEAERVLFRAMQRVGFGRIQGLQIRQGLPVLDPPPEVVRVVKLSSEPLASRPTDRDFALQSDVTEFFSITRSLADGTIRLIEIRHGNPLIVEIEAAGLFSPEAS